MDMTGEYRIPAPRAAGLGRRSTIRDPEAVHSRLREIQKVSDTEFTAKVRAKVGPVKANFGGKVTLSDLDPPNGYTITGEGTGGAAGFAKGSAMVSLDEDGGDDVLRYVVQAHVGGKLAQIGSRLIDATSRKMADDFFSRFVAGSSAARLPATTAARKRPASPAPSRIGSRPHGARPGEPRTAIGGAADAAPCRRRRAPAAVWVIGLTAIVGADARTISPAARYSLTPASALTQGQARTKLRAAAAVGSGRGLDGDKGGFDAKNG